MVLRLMENCCAGFVHGSNVYKPGVVVLTQMVNRMQVWQ